MKGKVKLAAGMLICFMLQGCHGCHGFSIFSRHCKHYLALQLKNVAPNADVFIDHLRIGRTDDNGNFCKVYQSYPGCVHQFWGTKKRFGFRYHFDLNHDSKVVCTGCPQAVCHQQYFHFHSHSTRH